MEFLNIFSEFKLDSKVEYFVSYYLYKIDLYKKSSLKFSVFNLHSIIKIIIGELSKNNINRNLKFFQDKLRYISKVDNIIMQNYKYKVNEIINSMTSNKKYALIVANNLLSNITNGKYAKETCYRIEKILFSSKGLKEVKDELNYLTDSLIVEYVIYGYGKEEIEKIMYNVFSKYSIYDKYVRTNFPVLPKLNNDNEIINYIDSLTVKNRIETLKSYFENKSNKFYYLFNIKGIVGDFLDIHLNNVNIYNWKTAHKFNIEIDKDVRKMAPTYEYGKFEKSDIHCSIYIESIDKDGIFEKIKQELDQALDILYTYHNIECKIEIDYSRYIVFDENKNFAGEGMTRNYDEDFKRDVRPLNYNHNDNMDELSKNYNNYSNYILNNHSESAQLIKNSIRYYRKAKETTRNEDKLLNYWICIENIFTINIDIPNSILDKNEQDSKFNRIFSIAPYLIFQIELINMYWEVYYYFNKNYIYTKNLKNYEDVLDEKSAKILQFNSENINLLEFIKNYELLDNKYLLELNQDIYKKYLEILNNSSHLQYYIKEYIDSEKEILLLLYRYRNMVVHNAQYDITFIEFYIKQLELLATRLLKVITEEFYKNEGKISLENIIINKYINQKQMIKDFDKMILKDWFQKQK